MALAADDLSADIGHRADLLAAERLLEQLRLNLAAGDTPIRLDQLLRAQSLLRSLARAGIDLRAKGRLPDLLAPVLATSRENERRIRGEIERIERQAEGPRKAARAGAAPPGLVRLRRAAVWRRILPFAAVAVAVAVLVVLGIWLISFTGEAERSSGTGPIDRGGGVPVDVSGTLVRDVSYYVLLQIVFPALYVLLPCAGAIAWLIATRPRGGAALRRMTERGRQFESLVVPPAETSILGTASLLRAITELRRPRQIEGTRLDAHATICETIREGGAPALRWRREARAVEYVLLCERGAPADHMVLLAEALAARLSAASVNFTRYDIDAGIDSVRYVQGRRSGPPVEAMANMRQRHAGARLILLGSGEGMSRRFEGAGGALADLLDAFDAPLLLSTVPADRWGWREARLEQAGMVIFPADDKGIERAVAHLTAPEGDAPPLPPIPPGEDALLASLHRDALRFASNLAPPEAEVGLLVRRLRGFLGDVQGFALLAAIAAFPRIEPAITARMALLVNRRPIDAALAGRIASLPWLKAGRMPDWLRLALLRALPEPQRAEIRAALILMLDDLRARAALEPGGTAERETRLDILRQDGVVDLLFQSVGLGRKLVRGESIFIRFLAGESIDELDQPDPSRPAPLGRARLALALAIAAAGAIGAWFAPAAWDWVPTPPLFGSSRFETVMFLALGGYTFVCWCLILMTTGVAGRPPRVVAFFAHILAYLLALYTLAVLSADPNPVAALVLGLFVLGLAVFHLLLVIDPRSATWRPKPIAAAPARVRLSLVAVALAVAALPRTTTGLDAVAIFLIPALWPLLWLLVVGERPDERSAIVRNLASRVMAGLCAAQNILTVSLLSAEFVPGLSGLLGPPNSPKGPLLTLALLWSIASLFIALRLDRRLLMPALFFARGTLVLLVTGLTTSIFDGTAGGIAGCVLLAGIGIGSARQLPEEQPDLPLWRAILGLNPVPRAMPSGGSTGTAS